VTATDPPPPVAATEAWSGATAKLHVPGVGAGVGVGVGVGLGVGVGVGVGVGLGDGVGDGVGVVGGTAACSTRMDCPATTTVPVRATPLFASTVNVAEPAPFCEFGLICSHAESDEVVHPQAADAVCTFTDRRPPSTPTDPEVGETVNRH
jgi:hypothetical protein